MPTMAFPERGDVIWLSLDPRVGHEQAGRRPAIVVSPAGYNRKVGLALVCPITSRRKGYPYEVALPPGLKIQGVVLSDHARSVDWKARQGVLIAKVPSSVTEEVLMKLRTLLV
jgi:mRNA interferase MazF